MLKRFDFLSTIASIRAFVLTAMLAMSLQACQLGKIAEYIHKERASQFIAQCEKDCKNNRFQRAEKSIRIAIDEAKQCPSNKRQLEISLSWLGYVLHGERRFYEAVPVYKEAIELCYKRRPKDQTEIAEHLERLANCYIDEGACNAAANALIEAITLREQKGKDQDVLKDRYRLADVQYRAGRYQDCISSCHILLDSPRAHVDKEILADTSSQLGKSCEKLGETKEAERAYLSSIEFAEHTSKVHFADSLQSVGMFYERMNEKSKSQMYCERSLNLHKRLLLKGAKRLNDGQKMVLHQRLGPYGRKDFILCLEKAKSSPDQKGDEVVDRVVRDIEAMPPKVIDVLARTGCRVVIVSKLSTTAEVYRNDQPTGWPDGFTWDAAGAAYDPQYNMVFVPRLMLTKRQSGIVGNWRIDAVVRHELGHALDAYLGLYSSGDAFRKPFLQDKSKLTEKQKRIFAYGLQLGDQGPSETFAELFNNLCGGACSYQTDHLYASFPQCYAALKDTLMSKQLAEPLQSIARGSGL